MKIYVVKKTEHTTANPQGEPDPLDADWLRTEPSGVVAPYQLCRFGRRCCDQE